METRSIKITDGPSKDRILDAFKYRKEAIIPISFSLDYLNATGMKFEDYAIDRIGYEDGSDARFILEGALKVTSRTNGTQIYHYKAYYDCQKRKGHISFIS